MKTQTQTTQKASAQPENVRLSVITKLEKRMGVRVWDGVLYNRDGITDPTLTILHNKVGREIREILAFKQALQPKGEVKPESREVLVEQLIEAVLELRRAWISPRRFSTSKAEIIIARISDEIQQLDERFTKHANP